VYPNQISAWKKQLIDQLPELFEDGRKRREPDADVERSQLYEEIGRLKVELDWLKKKAAPWGGG
jgi:putative transposase